MSLHFYKHNNFVQRLLDKEIVTNAQLEEAMALRKGEMHGADLLSIFVELGHVSLEEVCQDVADRFELQYVKLREMDIPQEIIVRVSPNAARFFRAIPYKQLDDAICVAMDDPTNLGIVQRLAGLIGCEVVPAVADPSDITESLNRYYPRS